MRGYCFVALFLSLLVAGCNRAPAENPAPDARGKAESVRQSGSTNEVQITQVEYGEAWPFTVERGVLRGRTTGQKLSDGTELVEVTFSTGGNIYYVNGTAKATRRYAELNDIWAADSAIAEEIPLRKNIGPIIERGLKLASGEDEPFAASEPAANEIPDAEAPVQCDEFEIRAEFQGDISGSSRQLMITIVTDLPDNTDIMVSVGRLFRNAVDNEQYSVDYLEEKSKVARWRAGRIVTLDQSTWQEKLDDKKATFRKLGQRLDIKNLDAAVTVSFVVPVNQADKRFGMRNANLSGMAVIESGGLRVVEREVRLSWPIVER